MARRLQWFHERMNYRSDHLVEAISTLNVKGESTFKRRSEVLSRYNPAVASVYANIEKLKKTFDNENALPPESVPLLPGEEHYLNCQAVREIRVRGLESSAKVNAASGEGVVTRAYIGARRHFSMAPLEDLTPSTFLSFLYRWRRN